MLGRGMDILLENRLVALLFLLVTLIVPMVTLAWMMARDLGLLSKAKKKIEGREASWKEWVWSIDDDERNQERYTSWQGIPFREIKFFRRHPNWPTSFPGLSEGMSVLMHPDFDPEDQTYRYEVGTMKHVNGYGGPIGALCYCCYRREGGKNQIKMFFASPGNRDVGKLPFWWRLKIVMYGDGTLEPFTCAQRMRILVLTDRVVGRIWACIGLVFLGLVVE